MVKITQPPSVVSAGSQIHSTPVLPKKSSSQPKAVFSSDVLNSQFGALPYACVPIFENTSIVQPSPISKEKAPKRKFHHPWFQKVYFPLEFFLRCLSQLKDKSVLDVELPEAIKVRLKQLIPGIDLSLLKIKISNQIDTLAQTSQGVIYLHTQLILRVLGLIDGHSINFENIFFHELIHFLQQQKKNHLPCQDKNLCETQAHTLMLALSSGKPIDLERIYASSETSQGFSEVEHMLISNVPLQSAHLEHLALQLESFILTLERKKTIAISSGSVSVKRVLLPILNKPKKVFFEPKKPWIFKRYIESLKQYIEQLHKAIPLLNDSLDFKFSANKVVNYLHDFKITIEKTDIKTFEHWGPLSVRQMFLEPDFSEKLIKIPYDKFISQIAAPALWQSLSPQKQTETLNQLPFCVRISQNTINGVRIDWPSLSIKQIKYMLEQILYAAQKQPGHPFFRAPELFSEYIVMGGQLIAIDEIKNISIDPKSEILAQKIERTLGISFSDPQYPDPDHFLIVGESKKGTPVSLGQIGAMAGDLFSERKNQPRTQPNVSAQSLLDAPDREIKNISGVFSEVNKKAIANYAKYGRYAQSPAQIDKTSHEYQEITKARELLNRYIQLANQNDNHFYPHNLKTYQDLHQQALDYAKKAYERRKSGQMDAAFEWSRVAMAVDAFACHFLGDAFAAGHFFDAQKVRQFTLDFWKKNEESLRENIKEEIKNHPLPFYIKLIPYSSMAWSFLCNGYAGSLGPLGAHDLFNEKGFFVKNERGDEFFVRGDNYLIMRENEPHDQKSTSASTHQAAFIAQQAIMHSYGQILDVAENGYVNLKQNEDPLSYVPKYIKDSQKNFSVYQPINVLSNKDYLKQLLLKILSAKELINSANRYESALKDVLSSVMGF